MSNHKKSPETLSGNRANQKSKSNKGKHNFKLNPNTKKHNIVSEFCLGKKLSCLDHSRIGETCLHSTVSGLVKHHHLTIPRKWEKLPNRRGNLVSVKQYWFSDDDVAKMKPLLSEGSL